VDLPGIESLGVEFLAILCPLEDLQLVVRWTEERGGWFFPAVENPAGGIFAGGLEETMTTVGIFEAKTRLSEIVRLVEAGDSFTITHRGRPVAEIVPSQQKDRRRATEAVRRLLAMPKIEGVSAETIREWIEEGRK